jgi:hypothetical protein
MQAINAYGAAWRVAMHAPVVECSLAATHRQHQLEIKFAACCKLAGTTSFICITTLQNDCAGAFRP